VCVCVYVCKYIDVLLTYYVRDYIHIYILKRERQRECVCVFVCVCVCKYVDVHLKYYVWVLYTYLSTICSCIIYISTCYIY